MRNVLYLNLTNKSDFSIVFAFVFVYNNNNYKNNKTGEISYAVYNLAASIVIVIYLCNTNTYRFFINIRDH